MVTSDTAEGTCEQVLSPRKKFPKDGGKSPKDVFQGSPWHLPGRVAPTAGSCCPFQIVGTSHPVSSLPSALRLRRP